MQYEIRFPEDGYPGEVCIVNDSGETVSSAWAEDAPDEEVLVDLIGSLSIGDINAETLFTTGGCDLLAVDERVLTMKASIEALDTIIDHLEVTGDTLTVMPFVKVDAEVEGFEIVDDDGRTARVAVRPGKIEITAAGERTPLPLGNACWKEALASVLETTFPSRGMKP